MGARSFVERYSGTPGLISTQPLPRRLSRHPAFAQSPHPARTHVFYIYIIVVGGQLLKNLFSSFIQNSSHFSRLLPRDARTERGPTYTKLPDRCGGAARIKRKIFRETHRQRKLWGNECEGDMKIGKQKVYLLLVRNS